MLTRRALALTVAASTTLVAQSPSALPASAPPSDPLLAEQQARIAANRESLSSFKLPPFAEPATRFEA